MKKTLLSFAAVLMMAGFTSNVMAQVDGTATATAEIITPISISSGSVLSFGNIATSGVLGTVTLPATSVTRTLTGGVTLPTPIGTVTRAVFTIGGLGTSTINIILPTGDHLIKHATLANTMKVNTFTCSEPLDGSAALVGGALVFYVGATLEIGTSQLSGVYTSTSPFIVQVNYN